MKRARIAELKRHLSRYLDHVREGGSVLVLDRDRPVARIVPLQGGVLPATRSGWRGWSGEGSSGGDRAIYPTGSAGASSSGYTAAC